MECLLYQIAELGCPNVCYAVDIKGSTLEKAEKQEVTPTVGSLFFSLQQFHYFGCFISAVLDYRKFAASLILLTIFVQFWQSELNYILSTDEKVSGVRAERTI